MEVLGKAVVRCTDEHVAVAGMLPEVELLHAIHKCKGRRKCEKGQKERNGILGGKGTTPGLTVCSICSACAIGTRIVTQSPARER